MSYVVTIENFTRKEMACQCGCGFDEMNPRTLIRLQTLRYLFGMPIMRESGLRCRSHNAAVGGAEKSLHLTGEAEDIKTGHLSTPDTHRLMTLAEAVGFTGIGVGENILHVDDGHAKLTRWIYTDSGIQYLEPGELT